VAVVVTHEREETSLMRLSNGWNFLCLTPLMLLGGCVPAPSMVLFGAAFPGWLFCIIGGVVATIFVHLILGRFDKRQWLAPTAISYPALAAAFALAGWLAFFPH